MIVPVKTYQNLVLRNFLKPLYLRTCPTEKMEGFCKNGLLVTITMSFLLVLTEAFENCNVGYWNFFICFDDVGMQGYCCDLQSDNTYKKCCYRDVPYQPPDNNDWVSALVALIILVVLAIIWWCIRCYRTRAEDRNIEAVVQRSTTRQAQLRPRQGQVRSNNLETAPPSYDQVTGEGTSEEYKELLGDYLYAMPPNYQAIGE